MHSRSHEHDQQRQTLFDLARQLDGSAQALRLIHSEEQSRHPALAAAAWHLSSYAERARLAIDFDDADALDEFITLRIGTLASMLQLLRAQWVLTAGAIGHWAADALAEVAYWLEVIRQRISEVLLHRG